MIISVELYILPTVFISFFYFLSHIICMLVALYLSTFINVCYCFIHIRVNCLI